MLRVAVRFPFGRYHATPPGHHVNEGQLEWPPSPWRIARALCATGFSRAGWGDAAPAEAKSLLCKLAASVPSFALPQLAAAHSRHYMPISGDTTTKVFDTFGYLGDGVLGIEFDVALSASERELAVRLFTLLPYLGRAESVCEARVLGADEAPPWRVNCVAQSADQPSSEPVRERLALMAPAEFPGWRSGYMQARYEQRLESKRAEATAKGKEPPKSLAKGDVAKLEASVPTEPFGVLCMDSAELQSGGWSRPPGTHWLAYVEVRAPAQRVAARPVRRDAAAPPTTALLTLRSDTVHGTALPPLRDTVRRMELLHRALVSLSDPEQLGSGSEVLTGIGAAGDPLSGHQHAFLLPVAGGVDQSRLAHVLIHAPRGLDEPARTAIAALRSTYAAKLPKLHVSLAGFGAASDFASASSVVGRAVRWRSETPFVPPRHPKARGHNTLLAMVQRELRDRGLPEALSVELEDGAGGFVPLERWAELPDSHRRTHQRFRHWRLERAHRAPPLTLGLSLRLQFAELVAGPIALGYGSHFGLGTFAPMPR